MRHSYESTISKLRDQLKTATSALSLANAREALIQELCDGKLRYSDDIVRQIRSRVLSSILAERPGLAAAIAKMSHKGIITFGDLADVIKMKDQESAATSVLRKLGCSVEQQDDDWLFELMKSLDLLKRGLTVQDVDAQV